MTDPHHRPEEAPAGGWSRLDTVLLVAIVLGAAILRFASLGRPGRARLRRDLLRARRVLVRHRHPGRVRDHRPRQPRPPAAREVADRVGHRPLRLRPVRLAGRLGGDRNGDRGPRLPAWPAPAAVDHDADRRHRRRGRRGRAAGDRLPAPRPLAHRDARLVHHVLRRRRGARRRPRSGPSTRADRCAVVVAPHPRSPVAAGGGHLPRRGGGREVVGGLRRAGGHRPRHRLGDRRAQAGRAGRRMGERGSAARSGARRCRRSSCWGSCRCSSTSPATPGGCRASWWRCRGSRDRSGAASGSTSARCSTSTPRCRATTPTSRRRGRGR